MLKCHSKLLGGVVLLAMQPKACAIIVNMARELANHTLPVHPPSIYIALLVNNHIYSTLFKIQERKSDRRSKEIEQRNRAKKGIIQTHTHEQGHVTLIYILD